MLCCYRDTITFYMKITVQTAYNKYWIYLSCIAWKSIWHYRRDFIKYKDLTIEQRRKEEIYIFISYEYVARVIQSVRIDSIKMNLKRMGIYYKCVF